jgi:hypothetical protein
MSYVDFSMFPFVVLIVFVFGIDFMYV